MNLTRVAVVGAGPNGLAAAVTLARAGLAVDVFERNGWTGGGAATRELSLPGFRHDVASAVHPMALASPFFQEFDLARRIDLVVPDYYAKYPKACAGGWGRKLMNVTPQGKVAGVVFAASVTDPETGYALTAKQVEDSAAAGTAPGTDDREADTGNCAA